MSGTTPAPSQTQRSPVRPRPTKISSKIRGTPCRIGQPAQCAAPRRREQHPRPLHARLHPGSRPCPSALANRASTPPPTPRPPATAAAICWAGITPGEQAVPLRRTPSSWRVSPCDSPWQGDEAHAPGHAFVDPGIAAPSSWRSPPPPSRSRRRIRGPGPRQQFRQPLGQPVGRLMGQPAEHHVRGGESCRVTASRIWGGCSRGTPSTSSRCRPPAPAHR